MIIKEQLKSQLFKRIEINTKIYDRVSEQKCVGKIYKKKDFRDFSRLLKAFQNPKSTEITLLFQKTEVSK